MNPPKCDALDYIHFLVAVQKSFSCTEAARCQPDQEGAPAHDAFTRLLRRQPPDTEALWQETQGLIARDAGVLVLDDTTLDKPYARKMALVSRHWSGKHRRVVWGINLLTLLWMMGPPGFLATSGSMTSPRMGRARTTISGTCWRWPGSGGLPQSTSFSTVGTPAWRT